MNTLKRLFSTLDKVYNDPELSWDTKYSLIFSENISRQFTAQLDHYGIRLDYYDPDSSYEDDVRAYYEALMEVKDRALEMERDHINEDEGKTVTDETYLDAGGLFHCEHCGGTYNPCLPRPVTDMAKMAKAFATLHSFCNKS